MAFVVTPTTGTFRGGTPLRFAGPELDMTPCQDDFADGVIGAIWTDVSAGSGSILEYGDAREIELDSGATPGSVAMLQTVAQMLDTDVQLYFRLARDDRPLRDVTNICAELALQLAASDSRLSFQVATSSLGREVAVLLRLNGEDISSTRTVVASHARIGSIATLRLLRAGRTVILLLGDRELFRFEWFADLAHVELGVRNDAVAASRVVARAYAYRRLPVITFAGSPALDIVPIGATRATGSAPVASCALDTVDLAVTGCTGVPVVMPDAFTYTRENDLVRFETRGTSLTICNDPILTKRRGRR